MSPLGRLDHGTLRRRVLVTGLAVSFLIVTGIGAFVAVNAHMRARLAEATDAYAEEEQIADELTDAVMRQLLLVPVRARQSLDGLNSDFQEAGDQAHGLIQQYLFRDLTPAERLQLETVKSEHQSLEVAAARASALLVGDDPPAAEAAAQRMVDHASALLGALNNFLGMRASGLDRLRAHQTAAFNGFYLAGGAFALFILVGSLYLGRFLQRRVAAPLAELADASRRIGEGELDARVPVDHDREFAAVATAFNRMGDELSRAQAELEGRNRELAELLETVRQAQVELIEAEKLSAMGRMTAGLAHELNNPLATVLGYGDLLRERLDSDEPFTAREAESEFLTPMLDQARRARDLVRNFMSFARGSGTRVGPVRLREALGVVTGLRGFAFEKAGLELSVGDVPDVWVRAEQQRLQEVVLNLVTNAFDAMADRDRGRLRISGERRGDTLRLSFEDEGPGVENRDRLFEPFYTTKAVGEGTGLGLALVHRAMEDFGGEVRAENRAEGGARFILTFTVVRAPPDASDPDPRPHAAASAPPSGESVAEAPDRTTGAAPRRPRILVVEDEGPLRRLQERILGRLDAHVLQASSVAEAWPILESEDVDLIVSDVRMPGESGMDLYQRVVEWRPELGERFLFVTGDVGDPAIVELNAERPGMFIHKPFELEDYLERVSAMLEVGSPS